jgi:hypothetical protein
MSAPEPITPESHDFHIRTKSLYDLEVTLVKFLERIFGVYRFDNPTLNLAQPTELVVQPLIVHDPDQPPVSYDYTQRAQTLALKVPPRIVRGRIPRTIAGEIQVDRLPDCPAIIVQVVSARVEIDSTIVTLKIFVNAYDENPDSAGYQDVLNMIEAMSLALTSFGQQGLDQAYVIQLPIIWNLVEADAFPHFIGEMVTTWEFPSGRPMPDLSEHIVPGEQIEIKLHMESEENLFR